MGCSIQRLERCRRHWCWHLFLRRLLDAFREPVGAGVRKWAWDIWMCAANDRVRCVGRWLEQRGYAFWSLGHCYSPEMDYKRRLGHRVLPRYAFLDRLQQVRGEFRARADGAATAAALVRGSVAIISGLQTKPELNGTRCTVLSRAENGERWVVELEGSPTTTLALNAGSLALVPAGGGGGGGGVPVTEEHRRATRSGSRMLLCRW